MTKRLNDIAVAKVAVAASAGGALPVVATLIDVTGFGRARFLFNFGNGAATTGALSTGLGIWKAATSGATYALITGASAAAVTSGAISVLSPLIVIDVPTDSANPWLQVSGSFTSTAVPHSATVELYHGVHNPPTAAANQVVLV